MKEKKVNHKKYFILFCLVLGIVLFNHSSVEAKELKLQQLDFDIQLQENGDMQVTEDWQVRASETNTLYKTFKIDSQQYSKIKDIKVSEITDKGMEQTYSQLNQEMYHVTKNCFYALENSKGQFEIAWGAGIERQETKRYKITYIVTEALKQYEDCTELYWQFIGSDFEIPADKVTGTINLPKAVDNMDKLRVWAHGPLNGNIQRVDSKTITFDVQPFVPGKYVEIRIAVLDNSIFPSILKTEPKEVLPTILGQEEEWATKANQQRTANQWQTVYIPMVMAIAFSIFAIYQISKWYRILRENPKLKPEVELPYYREIPEETQTPAETAFLYYFKDISETYMPKVLSATMLDLCLKGFLEFQVEAEKKKEMIRVTIKKQEQKEKLEVSEKLVYEILEKVIKKVAKQEDSFTMKEFEKYAQKYNETFLEKLEKIEEAAKEKQQALGNFEPSLIRKKDTYIGLGVLFLLLPIFPMILMTIFEISIFIVLLPVVLSILLAILGFSISGRYNRLTQQGINEQEKLRALKRYLEEYSLIEERTVPEVAIWEKYLVYATVFGIADKVIEQLKIKYPEIMTQEYMSTHNAAFFYMMMSGNHNSFVHSFDQSVQHVYTTGLNNNYSSGSGMGGGFSGGGGFGGGGGGRRRTLI